MSRLLIPLLIFAGFGLYFGFQVCPTFYFWDSAELTAAVLSDGVPHPPGFPTFLMLAGVWRMIAPIEPAYALNLFSAFFGALGLALWYLVIFQILGGMEIRRPNFATGIIALVPVILMGASFTYGIQATRLEVYSLNFAGFAALALLAMEIRRREHGFAWGKIAFFIVLGLMLDVHSMTIALAVPGLLLLARGNKGLKLKHIVPGLILSLAIALGEYAFIYLRAQGSPPLNWGDPSNFKSLLNYIFIRDFSTSIKGAWLSHFIDQLGFLTDLLSRQIGIPGLVLAALGAIYFTLNNRKTGLGLLVVLILNALSIALAADYFYDNYDLHGYLLVALAIVTLFLAAGLEFINQTVSLRFSGNTIRNASPGGAIFALAVAVAIVFGPIRANLFSADLSNVTTAKSYAGDFLEGSPDSSVILTSSYNTYFSLLAEQASSGRFGDRTVMNIYNWDHEWGRAQANKALRLDIKIAKSRQDYYRAFLNATMSQRPIYVEYDNSSRPLAGYLHPLGMGYILSTDTAEAQSGSEPDHDFLGQARRANDIESIRTWVLWLNCRGEYYRDRGYHELANRYFAALDTVASNAANSH